MDKGLSPGSSPWGCAAGGVAGPHCCLLALMVGCTLCQHLLGAEADPVRCI